MYKVLIMTSKNKYKNEAVEIINQYLSGKITAKHASDWALKIIISPDFEILPERICFAIHLLFDLHDEGKHWFPKREELINCENLLLDDSIPLPQFNMIKPKSKSKRGVLKEVERMHQRQGRKLKSTRDNKVQ